jgi:hypothetical protein
MGMVNIDGMTAKEQSFRLITRFSLLMNEEGDYVSNNNYLAKKCAVYAISFLREQSSLSEKSYYNVQYWDEVQAFVEKDY